MAGVFHVEFGINDTLLTRALENGNYASAERIILECTQPSFLDEGCYQRTPIHICLCGTDPEEQRVITRNLYLARLLVERGANVNHRVPAILFGSEYMGPGKTPLELLTDFYNDLTRPPGYGPYHGGWDPKVDVVVGLNKHLLASYDDVIEHIQDLIFIILSNGGDPNVLDENRMTPLHRTVITSCDLRLTQQLCDNGSNVNAVDGYGNTPLLSLCDIALSDAFDYLEDLSPGSDDTLEEMAASLTIKKDFLSFLLSRREIHINAQNNMGQTAVFHCVLRGDVQSTHRLLCSGADPSLRGAIWETRKRKRKLSPLFVMFMSMPLHRSITWQNMHQHLVAAPKPFAHLVDAGYFSRKETVEEMQEYLDQEFPEFAHLRPLATLLLHLMFGRTTSTLSQLATRVVFKQCLIDNTTCLQKILPVNTFKQSFLPEDLKNFDTYEEYVSLVLNHTVLLSLINMLGLPQDSMLNFEVELLLHQMAARFSKLKILRPDFFEDNVELLTSDSDVSVSPDEGDSDLEYW